ncbi:MAG: hypothetical protein P8X75_11830 [Limibacillus sp.]
MSELVLALLYGSFAGAMIPAGAFLARIERLQPYWLEQELRHSIIAFGGGVLVSAVALVLVPHGLRHLSDEMAILAFVAGGGLFAVFDLLQKRHGGDYSQMIAMFADFVPEALALGALLAAGSDEAALLAFLIGIQNLPEAFNAWREVAAAGKISAQRAMVLFVCLAAIGPGMVLLGDIALGTSPRITAAIMMVSAGGILFLMFQAIAVKAHLQNKQAPSLAAVAGFAVGILAETLI